MQTVQTLALPPSNGSTIFAAIGWTANSNAADRRVAKVRRASTIVECHG